MSAQALFADEVSELRSKVKAAEDDAKKTKDALGEMEAKLGEKTEEILVLKAKGEEDLKKIAQAEERAEKLTDATHAWREQVMSTPSRNHLFFEWVARRHANAWRETGDEYPSRPPFRGCFWLFFRLFFWAWNGWIRATSGRCSLRAQSTRGKFDSRKI